MVEEEENIKNKLIESLNYHGYFFQYAVGDILNNNDWETTQEYPLYSNITLEKKDIGTSIDFLASKEIKTIRLSLIIECKKVNINTKQWIFFEGNYNDFNLWMIQNLYRTNGDELNSLIFENCNQMIIENSNNIINGKEINFNQPNNNHGSDNIYKSLLQCAYSLQSIKEKIFDECDGSIPISFTSWYFIPLVVTNAKLKVCKFTNVSSTLETGMFQPENVTLDERNYLIYNFPLTSELTFNQRDIVNPGKNDEEIKTLQIIIVNSNYFNNLIKDIYGYFDRLARQV